MNKYFRVIIILFFSIYSKQGSCLSLSWSYMGPIQNMFCTNFNESSEPAEKSWGDNYLCSDRNIGLEFSSAGPIQSKKCMLLNEPSDTHSWGDNNLCWDDESVSLEFHVAGSGSGQCTQILEPSDLEGTWTDNYLCHKEVPWVFCDGSTAYFEKPRVYRPELDYICKLPVASTTGEAVHKNTNRCINNGAKKCMVGQGGEAGPGPHDVPTGAWYSAAAESPFPHIRCECGCFAEDTLLSLGDDQEDIKSLAAKAESSPVEVSVFKSGSWDTSKPLWGESFTVGHEENPLLLLSTETGKTLKLTDNHPVYVLRNDHVIMVEAQDLYIQDILTTKDGQQEKILSIKVAKSPEKSVLVYNLNAGDESPEGHLVAANNIIVGDSYWQKRLSEQKSRRDNLWHAAQNLKPTNEGY